MSGPTQNVGLKDQAGADALGMVDDSPADNTLLGRLKEIAALQGGNATIKYAAISGATSGNNTLVAAVEGKRIRVLSLWLLVADDVNVRFESDADGAALTGVASFPANGGVSLPFNPAGWFQTVAGKLLNMELSGAVQVSGSLTYQEV